MNDISISALAQCVTLCDRLIESVEQDKTQIRAYLDGELLQEYEKSCEEVHEQIGVLKQQVLTLYSQESTREIT